LDIHKTPLHLVVLRLITTICCVLLRPVLAFVSIPEISGISGKGEGGGGERENVAWKHVSPAPSLPCSIAPFLLCVFVAG
jgi:hypothetical protein